LVWLALAFKSMYDTHLCCCFQSDVFWLARTALLRNCSFLMVRLQLKL
jgi:hypothetical protein